MSGVGAKPRLAAVFGCASTELSNDEREFFADANPLGFILFKRNCDTPAQVRTLVGDLRESVGREDAPILIDQEGGRVARLGPPHWRAAPAAARFGELANSDRGRALEAVYLSYRLIADELHALGISVVCAPVLDVARPETTGAIGDRAFSADPHIVGALGLAACAGLLAGGVLPVIKHMPGHGRPTVDSHVRLPEISAGRAELVRSDFVPFAMAAGMGWGMSAHVCYTALDDKHPATQSPTVIDKIIRGEIGFAGFLVSDDICMAAMHGDAGDRAEASLAAGCDAVLHCDGALPAMERVAGSTPMLTDAACERLLRAEAMRGAPDAIDRAAAVDRLQRCLEHA